MDIKMPLLWRIKMIIQYYFDRDEYYFDKLLKQINLKKQISFIQIGANDGETCDPMNKYIIKNDWKGILIEPNPNVFKQLVKNYENKKNLIFENIAVTDYKGFVSLFVSDKDKNKLLSTVIPNRGSLSKIDHLNCLNEIYVPCDTLENIFIKSGMENIDILLIDVEGYESHLIPTINFNVLKPKIIHFEHAHITYDEHQKIIDYLRSFGFKTFTERKNSTAIKK
jgi:FkbM family methyltransferase